MKSKYGIPVMLEGVQAESILASSSYEERELSTYTEQVSANTVLIKVHGPLMRYGNFWEALFGYSAYSSITKELKKYIERDDIENIILDVDSPGGMVNGCAELADFIYQARDKKNIISYISGSGCSAAYYLASAAEKVYAHKMAKVGSIGVVACFEKSTDKNTKIIEVVSSKSKDKRPDVESKEGRAKIQAEIDALADIFMLDVSRYRDIDLEAVENTEGGTFIGEQALEMKLVDEISDIETIKREFGMPTNQTETVKAEDTKVEVAQTVNTDELIAKETQRVEAIMSKGAELSSIKAAKELVAAKVDADTAIKIMEASREDATALQEAEAKSSKSSFEKMMNDEENPEVTATDVQDDISEEDKQFNALMSGLNK